MSNVEELLKNCHLTQDKIENNIEIKNTDGINYLKEIENNSIDLVLTDPPYIISRESGMNTFYKNVKQNENNSMKTEDDWNKYKTKHKIDDDSQKLNYIKYGTIYGKKYSVQTDYGDWDQTFTLEMLDEFIN